MIKKASTSKIEIENFLAIFRSEIIPWTKIDYEITNPDEQTSRRFMTYLEV